MDFFIPCSPTRTGKKNSNGAFVTKSKKTGKAIARVYKRTEGVQAEKTWIALLCKHAPKVPMQGPLRLVATIILDATEADKKNKATRKLMEDGFTVPHWQRPDASNMIEAVQDAMGKLKFYDDDAQIVDLNVLKQRGLNPGLGIVLEEVA